MTPKMNQIVQVTTKTVSCDGGKGAAGHPKVYMNIGSIGWVECPYCSKRFELNLGAHTSADH